MVWVKACDLKSLGNGELLGVDIDSKEIMLANKNGKIYALDRVCTHERADLSLGFLGDNYITCPLHLSQFELETGKNLNPPAELPLKTYKVKIEDNAVYVMVE